MRTREEGDMRGSEKERLYECCCTSAHMKNYGEMAMIRRLSLWSSGEEEEEVEDRSVVARKDLILYARISTFSD